MPWEVQETANASWSPQSNERVYFASYYTVDDYVVDEEWTLGDAPVGTWELVS